MIKSDKEVTLKTRETSFLSRKPQKLSIAKNDYFLFSVSRIVPKKNEKWPAIAETKNQGFPLKWARMNQSFLFFKLLCVFIVRWLFLSCRTVRAKNISLLRGRLVFFVLKLLLLYAA